MIYLIIFSPFHLHMDTLVIHFLMLAWNKLMVQFIDFNVIINTIDAILEGNILWPILFLQQETESCFSLINFLLMVRKLFVGVHNHILLTNFCPEVSLIWQNLLLRMFYFKKSRKFSFKVRVKL